MNIWLPYGYTNIVTRSHVYDAVTPTMESEMTT